jgi:hypothetical protein
MVRLVFVLSLIAILVIAADAQWVRTAGPEGGGISVILVDGGDLYAGTIQAGIFKSTDGGSTWEQKISGLGSQSIVAMAKIGSYVIASGTEGAYRSSDGGDSWTMVPGSDQVGGASTLSVQGAHIIAGTGYEGVYASTDDGATWAPSNSGLPLTDGETSVPASVAAGSSYLIFGQDFIASGVFRSTDLGGSWFQADAGIPPADLIAELYYDGSTLYAAGTDVYRSDDLGATWRSVESGIPSFAAIKSFTTDGSKLFAAGAAGLFSTPLGDSVWTRVAGGVSETGTLSAAASGGSLFAGTDGDGVHRSTDAGASWHASNPGLLARDMSGLVVDGAALYGNGRSIFRTTDEGDTWSEVRGTLGDSAVAPRLLYAGGDTLFAHDGSLFNRLVRSVDGGATWTEVWPDLFNIGVLQEIVRTGSGFWTAAGAIYRSTDGGTSWSSVDSALTAPWVLFSVVELNGALYAHGQKVYRSTDDGASWEDVTPPATSQVDVMTAAGAAVYAGDRYNDEVFRSTDGGTAWTPVPTPTLGGTVDQLYGSGAALFLCSDQGGTFTGIFRTTSGGASWLDITPGLPADENVHRVVVQNVYLFAGVGGNSVWKRPLSDVTAVGDDEAGLPAATRLVANYPNPFNPSTTIAWEMASAGWVVLKVYDVLGRDVATLFDGVAEPGKHSVTWDAGGMPGGAYFSRMTAGSTVETKAMMLMR